MHHVRRIAQQRRAAVCRWAQRSRSLDRGVIQSIPWPAQRGGHRPASWFQPSEWWMNSRRRRAPVPVADAASRPGYPTVISAIQLMVASLWSGQVLA